MENGASLQHCEFCHAKLRGHSAAENYLAHMRRAKEREDAEEGVEAKKPAPKTKYSSPSSPPIEWGATLRKGTQWMVTYRRPLLILATGLLTFILIELSFDPGLRFRYLGTHLTYAFSPKAPTSYIVGSTIDIERWSERSGQLDTPMGTLKIEELGTVNVSAKGATRKGVELTVASNNWLLNVHREKGLESHPLSDMPALLTPAHLWLDGKGRLIRRQQGESIRVAKSTQFLAPLFPKGRVREGQTWTDTSDWIDALDGWTLYWSAERTWRAEHPVPCGDDTCILLTYTATLTPQMTSQPGWMTDVDWQPQDTIQGTGELVFDTANHQVLSHHVEYNALLRARIQNLSQIPRELRVGRRAFPTAGEIVFNLKNRIALQRN
jgi:hypothetical protein